MAIPILVLRLLVTVTMTGLGLIVGAALGGTVFRGQSGHGLGGLFNIFAGAFLGLFTGFVAAVILMLICRSNRSALTIATAISTAGVVLTFILIQILDSYNMW